MIPPSRDGTTKEIPLVIQTLYDFASIPPRRDPGKNSWNPANTGREICHINTPSRLAGINIPSEHAYIRFLQ